MCEKAKERHMRYKKERKFRDLLQELHYVEFAVYIYQKLEQGSENDSAYQNDFYFFKRVSEMLFSNKTEKITIDVVKNAVQKIINDRQYKEKNPLAQSTVNLYDRQLKSFSASIFDEKISKKTLVKGGEIKLQK